MTIPYPLFGKQEKIALAAVNLIGFDSAWADHPKKPGAICALRVDGARTRFFAPRAAGFDAALAFIRSLHREDDATLVAIDQPTIVSNQTGMRPAERVVAGTICWSGGAIQPAYRDKAGMFGDDAPIWRFLGALGFTDDPETAVRAESGGFVMEVYPALALLSLDAAFVAIGKRGPRYNPTRKTFAQDAWRAVCLAAEAEAKRLNLSKVVAWCGTLDRDAKPLKETQDKLDALLCLLTAARWRRERGGCAMIGDLESGYIVAPVSAPVRERLEAAAKARSIAFA